jgi:hypothetical protein
MPFDSRTLAEILGPINEGSSATYEADFVDVDGSAVIDVASINFTLFDLKTNIIINKRKNIDVLNVNGGAFTPADGHFKLNLTDMDNPVLNQRLRIEEHLGLFKFKYNGGAKAGSHQVVIQVLNINRLGQ